MAIHKLQTLGGIILQQLEIPDPIKAITIAEKELRSIENECGIITEEDFEKLKRKWENENSRENKI